MSRFLELVVVVPKVRIFGDPDIYVKSGSSVQLKCVVSQAVDAPSYVTWYHNGKLVAEPHSRWSSQLQHSRDTTSSTLSLRRVSPADTGNYSCHPARLRMAHIALHVLDGESEQRLPVVDNGGPAAVGGRPASLLSALALLAAPLFVR